MKTIWSNISFILIALLVGYCVFLRECRSTECPKKGFVLVHKSVWDSIQVLANKPPTIHYDTIIENGKTVYVSIKPIPVIDAQDTTIKHYSDSVVNNEINFHVGFSLTGQLLSYNKYYTPVHIEIVKTITEYVPKIVLNPIPVSKNGLWIYGTAGGNESAFLFGGGIDLITKKQTQIGIMYQRYGTENFYSVKIGVPITFKIGKE